MCAPSPPSSPRGPGSSSRSFLLAVVVALAALSAVAHPAAAWVASHNSIGASPGIASSGPAAPAPLDGAVPVAWPVASIAPPAEGCMSPGLSVFKVLAVVVGALAALKLPLVLAKVLLAKVVLLGSLALPLALPLLVPLMMMASVLPIPGFGMDDGDSPASDAAPGTPAAPGGGGGGKPAEGGGNASPESPANNEMEARGAWVEQCVQRVACQLNSRSRKECGRFRCAAVDWLGGS